jgi:hypothetical protein
MITQHHFQSTETKLNNEQAHYQIQMGFLMKRTALGNKV